MAVRLSNPYRRIVGVGWRFSHAYWVCQNTPGGAPLPPGLGAVSAFDLANWSLVMLIPSSPLFTLGVVEVPPAPNPGSFTSGNPAHNNSVWDIVVWHGPADRFAHPSGPWTLVFDIDTGADGFIPFDPGLPIP